MFFAAKIKLFQELLGNHIMVQSRQEERCPNGDPDLCARPPIKIFLGWHWSFHRSSAETHGFTVEAPLRVEMLLLGCTICGCATSLGTAILTPTAPTLHRNCRIESFRMSKMDTLMSKLARACEKLRQSLLSETGVGQRCILFDAQMGSLVFTKITMTQSPKGASF